MKKWIIISIILIAVTIAVFTIGFSKAVSPKKQAEDYAITKAKEEAQLVTVNNVYVYHGSETYFTVIGEQKDGNELVVWIPEKEKKEVVIKELSAGISEDQAISKLLNEEQPKEILGVRLGMEKDLPVWELSYLNNQSKLNYYYIHFDSGKWWRKIENL